MKQDLEKLLTGEELRYPISENIVFGDLGKTPENIWSFFFFAGYLRADSPKEDILSGELTYRLTIPNREVAKVYRDFVKHWHLTLHFNSNNQMLKSLLKEEYNYFETQLTELVKSLMSFHDTARCPEAVYHAFVLGLLANLRQAYEIRSNPESGYGRADIIMRPKTKDYPLAFIIEFKSIKEDNDFEKTADNALQQINNKAYESQLLNAGINQAHIRKLAIVIQGKKAKVKF